jgi:hypothetical protein
MTDIFQNMLLFNNVPDSFLVACSTELKRVVPVHMQQRIESHVQRAIDSNNRVLRFFVLLTALAHCESIRDQFSMGSAHVQLRAWIDATVPREWELFFMGSDKNGQPLCSGINDAKYGSMLDFVARMQGEYIALGWERAGGERTATSERLLKR